MTFAPVEMISSPLVIACFTIPSTMTSAVSANLAPAGTRRPRHVQTAIGRSYSTTSA
ncbi:hypothetical protein PF001_g12859 [Phytophthora fragariae]|uniref:Uncharacterized protein n=1 Tax=Phytophthora fragariae TaxID=53985 RepID=A0A6A4DAF8_9STRA|nr:hypothetical protein PF003_g4571 [Phytophthora fragariae]KAE9304869.1 hypothetical protein PF001_g12859 [Phytophthora fragariae]KAE9337184.1 hypothetical protein PF008_g12668 [Phytophthora fragariae]